MKKKMIDESILFSSASLFVCNVNILSKQLSPATADRGKGQG